jgi:hypothetical protein
MKQQGQLQKELQHKLEGCFNKYSLVMIGIHQDSAYDDLEEMGEIMHSQTIKNLSFTYIVITI